MVTELTATTFSAFIANTSVVDFWAPWCGPCKELAPVFEKVSHEFRGKIDFGKINVDDNSAIAAQYGVRGIPCLVVFSNGKEIDRLVGAMSEQQLRSKLDLSLAKKQ